MGIYCMGGRAQVSEYLPYTEFTPEHQEVWSYPTINTILQKAKISQC